MLLKDETPTYYVKLNGVIIRLTKATAQWILSFYQHSHKRGKRMYYNKNTVKDKYKYSFCDIVFDSKHKVECIVLKETSCYVTLAVFKTSPFNNPATATHNDFFQRRRWKSSELRTTKYTLATLQELTDYVYDLNDLFKDLTLETVK